MIQPMSVPKKIRRKQETQDGRWDEGAIPAVLLAFIFGVSTGFIFVYSMPLIFTWVALVVLTTVIATMNSQKNGGMKYWQVFYYFLMSDKKTYSPQFEVNNKKEEN